MTDVGDSASDTHSTGSVILLIHVCHPPALTTVILRWRDRSNPMNQPPLTDCERQCVISRQQGVITVAYICVRHIVAASGKPASTETIPQALKQFHKQWNNSTNTETIPQTLKRLHYDSTRTETIPLTLKRFHKHWNDSQTLKRLHYDSTRARTETIPQTLKPIPLRFHTHWNNSKNTETIPYTLKLFHKRFHKHINDSTNTETIPTQPKIRHENFNSRQPSTDWFWETIHHKVQAGCYFKCTFLSLEPMCQRKVLIFMFCLLMNNKDWFDWFDLMTVSHICEPRCYWFRNFAGTGRIPFRHKILLHTEARLF